MSVTADVALISAGDATVIAAVVTVLGTFLYQAKVHRDNRKDHGDTGRKIDRLTDSVDRVDRKVDGINDKVDRHLEWHVEGQPDGPA